MNKVAAKTVTTWAAIRDGYLLKVHRRMQSERGLATLEYVVLGAIIIGAVWLIGDRLVRFLDTQTQNIEQRPAGN